MARMIRIYLFQIFTWNILICWQGTQIYDANKGAFKDLGILDVMQIFGRAGRPQFDDFGEGTIITSHDKLSHYLSLMTRQNPIESQFTGSLEDNLNAEVKRGINILHPNTGMCAVVWRIRFCVRVPKCDIINFSFLHAAFSQPYFNRTWNPHTLNFTWIRSWWPEIWLHEYILALLKAV